MFNLTHFFFFDLNIDKLELRILSAIFVLRTHSHKNVSRKGYDHKPYLDYNSRVLNTAPIRTSFNYKPRHTHLRNVDYVIAFTNLFY